MFMTKLKNMCMRKGYRIESCSDIQAPSKYADLAEVHKMQGGYQDQLSTKKQAALAPCTGHDSDHEDEGERESEAMAD